MPSLYSPPGETPADLWLERSNLVGAVLGAVSFGVHVAVFAQCLYFILPQALRRRTRTSLGLVAYVCTTFVLGMITLACDTRLLQLMFVDNRAFPGGPNSWLASHTEIAVKVVGNVSYIVCVFLADGLLLWRTYILWNKRVSVVIIPSLLFSVSTAMSILTVVQIAQPNLRVLDGNPTRFTDPYFSTSITLTTLLTLLLVGRLVYMSYRAKWYAGSQYAAAYVSVAAMLVETALPYAATGVVFIVCFARGSAAQNLVRPVLTQIMCINPELIILRVAMGRALSGTIPAAAPPGFRSSRLRTAQTFELTTVGSSTLQELCTSPKKDDCSLPAV
ncbi:uncharacterized protein TRAVEDRAFT_108702 [Trametes versicolor FP-101664 SS1]|uniref:uncharacterized protein n=1 Tax=Trametes versicolor (strain FP-101664) TaxID=717944 RepID=UPI000462275A|nr:uncharacterized protein TRAVEDRAFT_108702 [Trametes versicolor FP-101664 SS1]EIW64900.1 hypothetical protein TRAVEDRAFT_108702 [Trametes versicolor FP-101664 SS1]